MDKIEMSAFERLSLANYKRWIIPLADNVIKVSGLKRGKILDVACGPGLLSKELAVRSKNFQVTGIDYSPQAIRLAKKNCRRLKNVKFRLANIYKLPHDSNHFDLVVCKDSFHHFDHPEAAIQEMLRVSGQNGVIYIQDLKRNLPKYIFKKCLPPDTVIKKLQYYSTRASYTPNEIKVMLHKMGIKKFSVKTHIPSLKEKNKYSRIGISSKTLKESLESRYSLIIKNRV